MVQWPYDDYCKIVNLFLCAFHGLQETNNYTMTKCQWKKLITSCGLFLKCFCHFPFPFLLCLGPLFFVPTLPLLLVCEVAITISLCTKKLVTHHSTPHFHTIVHNYGTYIIFVFPWTPLNIVLFNGLVVTTYVTHH